MLVSGNITLVIITRLFQLVTFLPFSLPVQSCKSFTVTRRLGLKTLVWCDFELNRNEPEALKTLVYCDHELNRNWIYEPEVAWKLVRVLSLPLWREIFRETIFIRMISLLFFPSDKTTNDLCQLWFAILTILTCFQWDWVSFLSVVLLVTSVPD